MYFGKYLLFVTVLFFPFLILAQEIESQQNEHDASVNKSRWGILSSIDLTYTGYSSILALEYEKNKTSFYVGPKISLTKTYLPQKGPWGGNAGFRYLFLTRHDRWRFFFNIDYQFAFYNAFKRLGDKGDKKNFVHEITLGYGVRFAISNRLYLIQSIGMGKYFESYYNYTSGNRLNYSGYDALIRLQLNYKFTKI